MKIGITEQGDATIHESEWVKKIDKVDMAILISKDVPSIDNLMKYRNKIILHSTITGWGGTYLEPNVKKYDKIFESLNYIIRNGFPQNQIVIRIDPIIASAEGIEMSEKIIKEAIENNFKRIRFSFIDFYPHVKNRFIINNISIPEQNINNALEMISKYDKQICFESCGEKTKYAMGCISKKDLSILNINTDLLTGSLSSQRQLCLCCGEKTELLNHKHQCAHKCLYCYWHD